MIRSQLKRFRCKFIAIYALSQRRRKAQIPLRRLCDKVRRSPTKFQQTAAIKFPTRCSKYQLGKISKWEYSAPDFAFLDENFSTQAKFFDKFQTTQNLGQGQFPPTPDHDSTALNIKYYAVFLFVYFFILMHRHWASQSSIRYI